MITHAFGFIHGLSAKIRSFGIAAVLAFAFFGWLSTLGATLAMMGFTAAVFLHPDTRRQLLRDPMFWLFLVFTAYLWVRTAHGIAEFPETRPQQLKDAANWLKLFAFLPFAVWVRGDSRLIRNALALALAGLLIGMAASVRPESLWHFSVGARTGFQLLPTFSGLIAATALLGLLLFAPRLLVSGSGPSRLLSMTGWFLAVYLSLRMLIASETRSAWIALILAGPPALWLRYARALHGRPARSLRDPHVVGVMLLLFALVIGFLGANARNIQSRLAQGPDTVRSLLHGQADQLPDVSLGYRYTALRYGLTKWRERPFWGWGTGSTKRLMESSGDPRLIHPVRDGQRWLDHFHNTYLEILLRFGLFGATLFLIGLVRVFVPLRAAQRRGSLSQDYALFLIASFALLLLWSFLDFRALHMDWRALWIVLAGITYSFQFADSPETHRPDPVAARTATP